MAKHRIRCGWARAGALETAYHDVEWGVPQHDDRVLFEFLTLEGAQAGLSWSTILRKRENYRRAFARFEPERVARFGRREIERLMRDPGIVRNRGKIESAVNNARRLLEVRAELGSFDTYLWRAVNGRPLHNRWRSKEQVPAETAESRALSKDLKRRGFSFVGPTTIYALMQAVGLVNDHLVGCVRHREVHASRARKRTRQSAASRRLK